MGRKCAFGVLNLRRNGMEMTIQEIGAIRTQIQEQLAQVIVGQENVIEELIIALFCQSHAILEGVPGLAKTLLISTLSRTMDLTFNRIQFTPDLMPGDITGADIIEEDRASGRRDYRFIEGPLFANVVLADEINRTPPKTQAALLEAMQERQVTVGRVRHALPTPFFVLATQNPIEQEGTYTLPEAQQDRFMFKILVKYPSWNEEFEVVRRTTSSAVPEVKAIVGTEEILAIQNLVREIPVSEHLIRYALSLVRQTRVGEADLPDFVTENLSWGAGPRAVQNLILGAKARALIHGRNHVTVEDVKTLAFPVLRHRIALNFTAESDGMTTDQVIEQLIAETPERDDELLRHPRFSRMFAG
ncbi:MAG: MoxR family ATPase [Planctomycetaceae bacterium]|nr:MoxR family ATPase [Planctomycetaceae bacterium]